MSSHSVGNLLNEYSALQRQVRELQADLQEAKRSLIGEILTGNDKGLAEMVLSVDVNKLRRIIDMQSR